jgi:hypothetical protein
MFQRLSTVCTVLLLCALVLCLPGCLTASDAVTAKTGVPPAERVVMYDLAIAEAVARGADPDLIRALELVRASAAAAAARDARTADVAESPVTTPPDAPPDAPPGE